MKPPNSFMKKSQLHDYLILMLILLAIGAGAYIYANPEMFEGRFSGKTNSSDVGSLFFSDE